MPKTSSIRPAVLLEDQLRQTDRDRHRHRAIASTLAIIGRAGKNQTLFRLTKILQHAVA